MSLFHRAKRMMNQISDGTQTKDPAFDEANKNFEQYAQDVMKTNQSVSTFLASIKSFTGATSSVTQSFAHIFNQARSDDPNDVAYIELSKVVERQQRELSRTHLNEVTQELTSSAVHQLAELTEGVNSLKKRIQERNSLFSELDYYSNKVSKLQKGKASNEKERAKKERNEQKLADLRKQFEPVNADLIQDLRRVWDSRLQTLGAAMRDCAASQQRFGQLLLQAADVSAAGDLPVSLHVLGSGSSPDSSDPIFVRALYDLKVDDEDYLKFETGDIIRLLVSEVDWSRDDTTLEGQLYHAPGRPSGLVPMNYVRRCEPGEELEAERKQETSVDLDDFLGDDAVSSSDPGAADQGQAEEDVSSAHRGDDPVVQDLSIDDPVYVRTLFPLETEDPDTLRLDEGDVIRVLAPKENLAGVRWGDEDSFWIEGELVTPTLDSRQPPVRGSFPSNYVEAYRAE